MFDCSLFRTAANYHYALRRGTAKTHPIKYVSGTDVTAGNIRYN